MVKFNSTSRLSRLSERVILSQSDTTVGFFSQNSRKLYRIKNRKTSKAFIKIYKNFKILNEIGPRVPQKFKNNVRRSKKISYVVKNMAFRVSCSSLDSQLLRDLSWHYSTSANQSAKSFNRNFCEQKTDIIIENKFGLRELSSSSLFKINQKKRKKIR